MPGLIRLGGSGLQAELPACGPGCEWAVRQASRGRRLYLSEREAISDAKRPWRKQGWPGILVNGLRPSGHDPLVSDILDPGGQGAGVSRCVVGQRRFGDREELLAKQWGISHIEPAGARKGGAQVDSNLSGIPKLELVLVGHRS